MVYNVEKTSLVCEVEKKCIMSLEELSTIKYNHFFIFENKVDSCCLPNFQNLRAILYPARGEV